MSTLLSFDRAEFCAIAIAAASCQTPSDDIPSPSQDAEDDYHGSEDDDDDSITPHDIVQSAFDDKMKYAFLNRLAEVFANQKTSHDRSSRRPKSTRRTDADRVTAAMLVFENEQPVVYIAQNSGLTHDSASMDMLQKLQTWLREIAISKASRQQRRASNEDMFKALVEFNTSRIEYYISEICNDAKTAQLHHSAVNTLVQLCKSYRYQSPRHQEELRDIVILASSLCHAGSVRGSLKMTRCIAFLARIKAAWRTFFDFASKFDYCTKIILEAVPGYDAIQIPMTQVIQHLLKLTHDHKRLQKVMKKCDGKTSMSLYTHAEMQLLLQHGSLSQGRSKPDVFSHMGSSKKTCYLCQQTLYKHGVFSSRGSHHKISPQWTINPNGLNLGPSFYLKLHDIFDSIKTDIFLLACNPSTTRTKPPVAESSVGLTTTSLADTVFKETCRSERRKAHQPGCNSEPLVFGPYIKTITVLRLPAKETATVVEDVKVFRQTQDCQDDEDMTLKCDSDNLA